MWGRGLLRVGTHRAVVTDRQDTLNMLIVVTCRL